MGAGADPGRAEIAALGERLRAEVAAGRGYLPAGDNVLRAFARPFDQVKVLIVGQDPYPTVGHPIGLSFAVDRHVRPLPRSLDQHLQRARTTTSAYPAPHGDLSAWSDQGVMLLNRVLTVGSRRAGVAPRLGMGTVTEHAIRDSLRARPSSRSCGGGCHRPPADAGDTPVIESAHPSPLSASRDFFGSRPFRGRTNSSKQGAGPVNWRVPDGA